LTASAMAQAYTVQEYNPATEAVINTVTFTTAFINLPNYACLVKTNAMTFSSVDVAYIYFSGVTVNCAVFVSGVSKSAFSGTGTATRYTGISAYKNGGTYIIGGIPYNGSMPQSYYAASPYAVWTAIAETSYLSTYADLNTTSAGNISLIGIPSNISTANFTTFGTKIVIDTAGSGTITTVTQAGLAIIPTNSYTGFGWSSGKFKSTAATKFSPYILDNGDTPVTITETVTDYGVIPQSACAIGTTTGRKTFVYTIAGKPAQIAWGGFGGAMPICEYGAVLNTAPIVQYLTASGNYVVTYPTAKTWQIATVAPATYEAHPISRDVVQLTDSYGTIVDTSTGTLEVNAGGHNPSFVSDIYLTGTELIAYQTPYRYTNAIDAGVVTTGTGIGASAMSIAGITGSVFLPFVLYQSASGTLYARALIQSGVQVSTDTAIAYVSNGNLPPPVDAIYRQGGVQLVSQSALQTINWSDADGFAQYYAGYTLANQYPVSYQFFNLFGQLYGFDGLKIYRMPINGATAGTPEQVAIATGLTFITNSPTVAYFSSDFDNSIFVFTGGQTLDKLLEMTALSAVTSGEYSVKESSLYLALADSTILTVRDNLAGKLTSPYTDATIYTTDLGTFFVNDTTPSESTRWSYYAEGGSPLALTFQSGFYGFGINQMSRITQVVMSVKVTDPTTTALAVTYKWTTADTNGTETAVFLANTYNASSTGYVKLQFNPTQALVSGVSIGLSSDSKIVLFDITLYYTDGGVMPLTNRLP